MFKKIDSNVVLIIAFCMMHSAWSMEEQNGDMNSSLLSLSYSDDSVAVEEEILKGLDRPTMIDEIMALKSIKRLPEKFNALEEKSYEELYMLYKEANYNIDICSSIIERTRKDYCENDFNTIEEARKEALHELYHNDYGFSFVEKDAEVVLNKKNYDVKEVTSKRSFNSTHIIEDYVSKSENALLSEEFCEKFHDQQTTESASTNWFAWMVDAYNDTCSEIKNLIHHLPDDYEDMRDATLHVLQG